MADPDRSGGTLELPFQISCISSAKDKRYMLYDIDLITWLRREHHILGVLVGTLPQAPSQNIFLGLPLTLMPEEARLLVEKGLARIVDDRAWFRSAAQNGVVESKVNGYRREVVARGLEAADAVKKAKDIKMADAMEKMRLNQLIGEKKQAHNILDANNMLGEDSVFADDKLVPKTIETNSSSSLEPFAITPTSALVLKPQEPLLEIPQVAESSYSLFKLLHSKGYFISPGLRFGCQYMAYPGDPLRYHSHFLAVAIDWEENIDLIDIIGGGRLATGVKKSFLLGGVQPASSTNDDPKTRTFSIEWAGM
ncbi:MAG: hypothetical protein GOMPHAMPRED_007066 [Gomphillus americanus]|uniref:tRNA-splicing endonuclease subunit Sen34 n=1 Tax=Gomphillus americanus TaxID=1940652 RepID=A0A8H3ERK0_9LECA|nr:MAG: hypothetical protein GOMPHAMPRED_007066 [Gomphillus americanus]